MKFREFIAVALAVIIVILGVQAAADEAETQAAEEQAAQVQAVEEQAVQAADTQAVEEQTVQAADTQAAEEQAVQVSDTQAAETKEVNPMDYTLSSDPSAAGEPITVRPETPETSHRMIFKYSETVVLRGIFEKYGYFFKIPKYWDTKYCLAQIEYTVSPLIQDVPASLTFFINNHPIYSCGVDYKNGVSQIAFVTIPVDMLKEGYNEFSITGYVRLYDDEECLDDFSGANWISISENSFIEAGYDLGDFGNKISYYPYPLISTMDENGVALTIFVPAEATEEELRAAFLLRADLGDETVDEDRIQFKTLAHYSEDRENALIIARKDRLPADAAAQMPAGAKTEGGALVYEYGADGGYTMVVTAAEDKDLYEAACMLMDEERVTQEKADWAFVPAESAQTVLANRSLSMLIENGETIKGITNQDGIDFIGPFHQEAIVYLPISGGFVLGEGGKIELQMRYSDNLDFDRSLVTVYWGSTPVASKKLSREKENWDVFSFMMPADVVGTHASSIKIAFDLEIKELYCTKRADEMPWAYVSGDSTLFLPVGTSSFYDLSLRPYPFQQLGQFKSLAVVVPEEMSDTEYAVFGRTAALMGSNVSPYGSLRVWKAGAFPKETENAHVITIGTWKDNSFLRELNDKLSFAFTAEGARFDSNAQLMLSERYAAQIGIMQIIRSPYQEGRAILAVCGPDDAAFSQIDRFAAVQKNTWTFSGDAFLIDADLETKAFTFLQEQPEEKPSLIERFQEHQDAVILTLISTAAMLLMLIAVVLILIRFRRNRREEDNK